MKRNFKIGDRVKIGPIPKNREEGPTWSSAMDETAGKFGVVVWVSYSSEDGRIIVRTDKPRVKWWYLPKWLEENFQLKFSFMDE